MARVSGSGSALFGMSPIGATHSAEPAPDSSAEDTRTSAPREPTDSTALTEPLSRHCHDDEPITEPTAELSAAGNIDTRGRFLPGNTVSLKSGERSRRLAAGALLPPGAPLPHEREAAVLADLGDVSNITTGLVRRYVHAELVAEWLESNLIAQGVMTTKGKQRAAVATYLAVVDRLVRLGTTLGLDRRPKALGTLEAVRAAVERVNP